MSAFGNINTINTQQNETNDLQLRYSWDLYSECMIYSRSKNKWFHGEIIDIYIDQKSNKEWFIVEYNGNKKKTIQRFCKDIKPITINNKNNIKQKQQHSSHDIMDNSEQKTESGLSAIYRMKNEIEELDPYRLKHKLLCYMYHQLLHGQLSANKLLHEIFISPSHTFSYTKRKYFNSAFNLQNIIINNFNMHLDINICVLCAEYGYKHSLDGKWHTNFGYLEVKDGKGNYGMKDKRDNRNVVVTEYFEDDEYKSKVKGTWTDQNMNGTFEFTFVSPGEFEGTYDYINGVSITVTNYKWNGYRIENEIE